MCMCVCVYHDGSEASGSSLPLKSQSGNGPKCIWSHIQLTLKHRAPDIKAYITDHRNSREETFG